ncbi:sulfurtransferase [Nitrospira sp.]|nr:sulfurtransferase [Nitrospira sp.]
MNYRAWRILRVRLGLGIFTTSLLAAHPTAVAQSGPIDQAIVGDHDQKTHEVNTDEIRRVLADGSVVVIDARTRSEYVTGHIPGALNFDVPPDQVAAALERLLKEDKGRALVLYCNGPYCQASRRLGEHLVAAGFTRVQRYQLGMPVWRALGGPTEIELEGIVRIYQYDRTAVFFDARSPEEFARGSLPGAHNVPADRLSAGALDQAPLPKDDFNTRIVLFGRDAAQARSLADSLSRRPWHNVTYYPGRFETLREAIQ